ncbi:MAG: ATP-dependent helicase [Desulfovibrionaceae bacterium]|nr:ATP-dependent helicase [Desulfovibrionaceae bacterium]
MVDISQLNEAQRQAVTAPEGPVLVIAGAGSGKTRTIVHRLAWLVEQGLPASSILLLTFTRKAAHEMLDRASLLLDQQLMGIQGGTFHAFAFSVLRRYPPGWVMERGAGLSVMDAADSTSAIQHCREALSIGRGDRSFPRTQTILGLFSKARNKELELEEVLRREAQHLLPHASDLGRLAGAYAEYRREHALLDYDDLLFELEAMLRDRRDVLELQRQRFRQILVDEYQDTNRVQARLVRLLAGEPDSGGNVMAVGDDAQSIYAFRGATVHNILDFPRLFPGTRLVRLEENYRSVQPVLDVANAVLENAPEGYRKRLFSRRGVPDGAAVRLYHPLSDLSQAQMAARRIEELLERFRPCDIAVLFRAGYQSYHLEVELNKRGIGFRKYGGLRYAEASHVKDVLAFARLVVNPLDLPSFERVAGLSRGIGPKTSRRLYEVAARGDQAALAKACAKYAEFLADMELVTELRLRALPPDRTVGEILEHYRPRLEMLYPDDWPRRLQGLEELSTIAAAYDDLELCIGDLSLESPDEQERDEERDRVVLSTVHSAKGLEWSAVLIIDLVEDRFPSRHALTRPEDFEEERRLMYVACTRARDTLDLFVPMTLFSRAAGGQEPATPSPFVRELPLDALDERGGLEEIHEGYGGALSRRRARPPAGSDTLPGAMFSPRPSLTRLRCGIPPGVRMEQPEAPDEFEPAEAGEALTRVRRAGRPEDPEAGYLAAVAASPDAESPPDAERAVQPRRLGYCRHRVFGRGKIVEELPPDKYRVNFPGFGLKVILAAYLSLEGA